VSSLAGERTLEALEFPAIRERLAARTVTERGRARASALEASTDLETVRTAQALTAAARTMVEASAIRIAPAADVAPIARRASLGAVLSGGELRAIANALASASVAYEGARASAPEALRPLLQRYVACDDVRRAIDDALDERGEVRDRASPALARIRRELARATAEARERVSALVRSAAVARMLQDAIVTIRDGRYVVPVKAEFAGAFPGIVHDTSASGQTLFIEPLAALDDNNRVRTLHLRKEREIARILEELSRAVGAAAERIDAALDVLAELDLVVAKAILAVEMRAAPPAVGDAPVVRIVEGRHPLLGERAVPQSVALDERTRLMVISGPNMGGKTVALKMAGLFVLMAYAGLQLPAAPETVVGGFTRIVADIGDEQSIAADLSTFGAHLQRLREILATADERTLVLIDEIGAGTEPAAGAALARAVLERLLERRSAAIVTTHAAELKVFAHTTPGACNAGVRFDPRTFAPLYALDLGIPGASLAFPLARLIGIPDDVVRRAESLLESGAREFERALGELSEQAARLREREVALDAELGRVRERERELRQLEDDERRRSAAFGERAEAELRAVLRAFALELHRRGSGGSRRPRVTQGQQALLERAARDLRARLGIERAASGEPRVSPREGDRVYVASLDCDATVMEVYDGDRALVAAGPLKAVVPFAELEPAARTPARRDGESGVRTIAEMRAAIRAELDVRGLRADEAWPRVERWVDDAAAAGIERLRLIHGKGTGRLGRSLQEWLRAHPGVAEVRYGEVAEGGGGVTIVSLR